MNIPFDADELDRLMEGEGIDLLLATSKHNVQYLLGGYRFFFFDYMDAIGLSRYLPILVYPRGRPNDAAYFANSMEPIRPENNAGWPPRVSAENWGTQDSMAQAIAHIEKLGVAPRKIGIESGFLPTDAFKVLEARFGNTRIEDAVVVLERLRAVKTAEEIAHLRRSSENVVDSMLTVFAEHGPGTKKSELIDALRLEETKRGLIFEYCLATVGRSLNRSPNDDVWNDGEIASLDSGGNYKGYIGDLCRMAVLGEPDSELQDLLAEVDSVQQAARKPIRPGTNGGDIIAAGLAALKDCPHKEVMRYVAHGMGLVSHEAPRLTSQTDVPYPASDADKPLQEGMVVSIETTLPHPKRGFIKLEDTVLVTADGWEGLGDDGRGWTVAGTRVVG